MTHTLNSVARFYHRGLLFSLWFWLSLLLLLAFVIGFLFANRAELHGGRDLPIITAALAAAGPWARSVRDYNRITDLAIDWESLSTESPLYETLKISIDQIRYGSVIATVVASFVFSAV